MKNVYFLSDAHLGSLAIPHQRMQERRLVRFLDSIKEKAAAIYLLGDMFDFWYEYKYVVPKGFIQAITTSGPMNTWRRSVASFCIRRKRRRRFTAMNFFWLMATAWATRTSRSN